MARRDATRTACCIGCRPTVVPSVGSRDFLMAVYARCEFHYEFVRYVKRGSLRAGYSKGSVEENILVQSHLQKAKQNSNGGEGAEDHV